jgi:ubiquinone/menaquinone biosynthesis C-methylase UbiE
MFFPITRAYMALIEVRFGSKKAAERASAHGLADRFSYQVSVAERLPFPDASFDLVTCQTVLIHTPNPGAALDDMLRVARPNGLILAAEPNNVAGALIFDSVSRQAQWCTPDI